MRITTRSLRLVALDPATARHALRDRDAFAHVVGARVPREWPADDLHPILQDAALPPWGAWVIVHRAPDVVVGDVGFKGAPDAAGEVEIGYSVLPQHRGRGIATEAAGALAAWALARADVTAVRAETERGNAASDRVLEKTGFQRSGTQASLTFWRLTHQAPWVP